MAEAMSEAKLPIVDLACAGSAQFPPTHHYINHSGDSMVSGTLSLGGDLYDLTNSKKIYDSATGKFDPSVMPYEKGDLVSDWATSSYTSGYYEPVDAGNVKQGVSYGRGGGTTGTLVPPSGSAGTGDVRSGKTFYSGSWTVKTGTAKVCDGDWHYKWIWRDSYFTCSGGGTDCRDAAALTCNISTVNQDGWGYGNCDPVIPGSTTEHAYTDGMCEGSGCNNSCVYTCARLCY